MSRSLLILLVSLAAGVLLGFLLEPVFSPGLLLWALIFMGILVWLSARFFSPALAVLPMIAGFVISSSTIRQDMLPGQPYDQVWLKIHRIKTTSTDRLQAQARLLYAYSPSGWEPLPAKCLVWISKPPDSLPLPGEVWVAEATEIRAIQSFNLENGFNPAKYWKSQGIFFEMNTGVHFYKDPLSRRRLNLRGQFFSYRDLFISRIDGLPLDESHREILKALIIGEKGGLGEEISEGFKKAGIAHIMAVSGLHVGIIFLLISKSLKLFGFRRDAWFTVVVTLVSTWFYAGICGMGASVVRAASMLSLYQVCRLARIRVKAFQVIGLALLFHIMVDPRVLQQSGAQLSYGAVAGILWFVPRFSTWQPAQKLLRIPFQTALVSASAQIALFPILIKTFGSVPLMFLIGNLLLVPVWIAIFYAGLGAVLLEVCGVNFSGMLVAIDWCMDKMLVLTTGVARLPGNSWTPSVFGFKEITAWFMGWLFFAQWVKTRRPGHLLAVLMIVLILLVINLSGHLIFVANPRL